MSAPFPRIEALIPHRGSMRLIDEVLAADPGTAVACRGRVPPANPLAAGGVAPALLAIEMGAQAAGALVGLGGGEPGAGGPPSGYLVAIRKAELAAVNLPVDTDLWVTARAAGRAGPLALFEVEVCRREGGAALARAAISVWSR